MWQNNEEEDYYVLDEGFLDKGTFNLIKKWKTSNEKNRIKKFKSTTVSPQDAAELKDEISTMRTEDISYDEYKKAFHKFCTYIHTIDKGVILRTIKLTKNKDDENFTLYVEYADNTKKIKLPDDCKLYHLTKVSGIKKLIPFFKGKSERGYLYDKPRIYFTIRKKMPKFLADYKVTDKMYTYECEKDIKDVYIDPLVPSFIQGAVYIETQDPVPVEQVGVKAGTNKEDEVEAKNEAYIEEKAERESLKTLEETGFDFDEFFDMLIESGLEDLEPVIDNTDEEIHDGFEAGEVEEGAINFFKKKLKERKNKADWVKQGYTKEDLEEIKNIKDQIKKVGPDIVKKYNKDKDAVNSLKDAITDILDDNCKAKPKFDFSVVEEDDKYYIIICILSKELMDEVNYIDDVSDNDFTSYIRKTMSAVENEIKEQLSKSDLITVRVDPIWSGTIKFTFSKKYNGTKESVESLYEADDEEEKEESNKEKDKSEVKEEVKDDESKEEETKDSSEPKVIKNDEDESPKEDKDEDQTTEDNEVAKAEEDTTDSNTEGISDEEDDKDKPAEKEDEEEKHTPESDEEDEKPEDETDKAEEDSEAEDIDDELSNDVEEIEDNDDDDLDLNDEDEEVDDDSDDDEDFGEDNDEESTDDDVYDDEEDEDELSDDDEDFDDGDFEEDDDDDSEDVEDIDTAEGISTDAEVVQEYKKVGGYGGLTKMEKKYNIPKRFHITSKDKKLALTMGSDTVVYKAKNAAKYIKDPEDLNKYFNPLLKSMFYVFKIYKKSWYKKFPVLRNLVDEYTKAYKGDDPIDIDAVVHSVYLKALAYVGGNVAALAGLDAAEKVSAAKIYKASLNGSYNASYVDDGLTDKEYISEYCRCMEDYIDEINESSTVLDESEIDLIEEEMKDLTNRVSSVFGNDKDMHERLNRIEQKMYE